MIFVMNPTWKTGFASSMWPKWPGHSVMLPKWQQTNTQRFIFKCLIPSKTDKYQFMNIPAHVWHLPDLSITPCRGSISPPSLGRPPSVVSGYLMPPSVTDIRFWKRFKKNSIKLLYIFTTMGNIYTLNIPLKYFLNTWNAIAIVQMSSVKLWI